MKQNSILTLLICILITSVALAQEETPQETFVFKFKQTDTPILIRPFSCTAYSSSINAVRTVRGDVLRDAGSDTIIDFHISPLGLTFFTIEKGEKLMKKAQIFTTYGKNEKVMEWNPKTFGNPGMIAYTPEGRSVLIATDNTLYELDSKTLIPLNIFEEYPGIPDQMLVSPNGYYLVLTKNDKAVIYNLEEKTIRTEVNAGEKINDIAFSPDNTDFAILTDDGVLNIYSTRTFEIRKMIDDLGEGKALAYNLDGKYAAVVVDDNNIVVVNLLQDADRENYMVEEGGVSDIVMIPDALNNTVMIYTVNQAMEARKLPHLKPFYNKLIDDEVNSMMEQWLKMLPGETMEQYRERVTSKRQEEMRNKFEFEVSTRLAGNILSSATMNFGAYDRTKNVLEITFDKLPTIYLPVPESDISAFVNSTNLKLNEVLFGVTPTDEFEIVYADIYNAINGKNYIFDNRERAKMEYMVNDDVISLEALQQQQMAEIKLKEIREQVIREAKQQKIISDNTNITVDSRLSSEYDANGKQILNYIVTFSYDVAPGFSFREDYGPGKYHIEESGSALSTLKIAKDAFEGELKPYFDRSKKVNIKILGTADATPIISKIMYDGIYGNYDQEPVYIDNQLTPITVTKNSNIKENPQLAFVRALGVKNYLEQNITGFDNKNKDYRFDVSVSNKKGSEFRRIVIELTFIDVF